MTELRYTGVALYGSCYQQCAANLLHWRGMPEAETALGTSWGFSWEGGAALEGSGRWIAGAGLRDLRFGSAAEALTYERKADEPFAAAVDAYYLPSPFEGKQHITHCVVVIAASDHEVRVMDPMNNPSPVAYPAERWERMRSEPAAQGARILLADRGPAEPGGALLADLSGYGSRDEQALNAYLRAYGTGSVTGPPDVSGVAAERMYLAKLLRRLAAGRPELTALATEVEALERRWYMAHTIGLESGGAASERQIRLIGDLGRRDLAVRHKTLALLSAGKDEG